MREFYEVDEFKKIDEYKKFEAENYSKSKEIFETNEFKNDISEISNTDTNKKLKDNSIKEKKTDQQVNNDKINNVDNNINNLSNNNIDNTINEVSKSLGGNIASTVSSFAGTAAATVVGSIGAVVVCSNFLVASPKMEIININTGADYVYYDVDISDLSEDINYSIIIKNAYGSFEFTVDEGKNQNLVSGLKPYCEYSLSLVSDNKEFGGYRTYYEKSFYTKKAENPEAILTYNTNCNYDNLTMNLDYDIFISDYYKQGINYYYTITYQEEIIFTDNNLSDDYYFSGELFDISEGDYIFNYYCNLYDEDIVVGTDTITVIKPDDLIPPVIDYEINSVTMTGSCDTGYNLSIDLENYNSLATYELSIVSNSFSDTYIFDSKHLELSNLLLDYQNTKIKLKISHNDDSFVYDYNLIDLIGINLIIDSQEYNQESNSSLINYQIIGDYQAISFEAVNNYNEEEICTNINNQVMISLSGNVLLTTYLQVDDLKLCFKNELDLGNRLTIENVQYGSYSNSNAIYVKLNKYLPTEATIDAVVDDIELEKLEGYNLFDGSYYVFDGSALTGDETIKICAKYNDILINCEEQLFTLDLTNIPEYTEEFTNPADSMITYNDDDTFNAYIPINFETTDSNLWYRILLNDEYYIDSREYMALFKNLDSLVEYQVTYQIYYDKNGVSYYLAGTKPIDPVSCKIDDSETRIVYDEELGTFEIRDFYEYLDLDVVVYYKDGSSETVTIDYSNIGQYDNTKLIDKVVLNYSTSLVDEEIIEFKQLEYYGNKYKEYTLYVADPYELIIDNVSYGAYGKSNYLYIKSEQAYLDDYELYLEQSGTRYDIVSRTVDYYIPTVPNYYEFDISGMTIGTSFDIKVINKHYEEVILANTISYTIETTDINTLVTVPSYSKSYANPGDCYVTYNDDDTFNSYIPINFECSDSNVWYRIRLGDEIYIDSRDYIAFAGNLDSEETYSIKYQIYYDYNGISYYVAGEWPSGGIEAKPNDSGTRIVYDIEAGTFELKYFYENMDSNVTIIYTDGTSEIVTLDSSNIGQYDNTKIIDVVKLNYSVCEVDEELFNNKGIEIVGNKYKEYILNVEKPYELVIDSISYGSYEYNNYLYIKATQAYLDSYTIRLECNDEIYIDEDVTSEGYYIFNTTGIPVGTSFNIIVLNKFYDEVHLVTPVSYTIETTDINTLVTVPSYTSMFANPGDCMISYNDDGTYNAYIPINFECSDSNVWYRIILSDNKYIDSRDYIAFAGNLESTEVYPIKYQIYYDYNGISYYVTGEYPSGSIFGTIDNTLYTASYDPTDGTNEFIIKDFYYYIDSNARIYYKDGSYEDIVVTKDLGSITGNYTSGKIIDYVFIKYSTKLINEETLNSNGITLIGNKYVATSISANSVYDISVDEMLYDDYDSSKQLLIKSSSASEMGATLYISQDSTIVESTSTIGDYLVFDTSSLTLDSTINLKAKIAENDIVLLNKLEYTLYSNVSSVTTIPPYMKTYANPGNCYTTYNDDGTFNAYLPINFECDDENLWYRIKIGDDKYIEGGDYIASIKNLDSSINYSILYQYYYRYNGISYYIAGEWPSGTISGSCDISGATITTDAVNSTFTISGISLNVSDTVTIHYSDGSTDDVIATVNTDITGTYDNTKEISSITISYSNCLVTTSFEETLASNNIALVGSKYKEINITNS
ncbi:MAG: hypothetical protein ACI35S_00200 [Anaeroplasma sp.]